MQIKVRVAEGFPLKILKAETSDVGIAAQLEELAPSSSYLVSASVLPTASQGLLKGWIKLLTDHPGIYREILVPVSAYVGPGGPVLAGDELDISGPVLGGGTIDLKSLRVNVAVVVFWASWCGHCQKEIPELIELHNQYHSKGLTILGVNSDKVTDQATAAIAKWKIPWSNIHFASDAENPQPNPLMVKHQINGIPALFVIDRDGRVKWIGLRNAALKVRVEQLLRSETAVSLN